MKNVNYRTLIAAAVVAVCSLPAAAQYAPQSNTVGANGSLDQQIIGDTTANADRTQSTSNQIGNSANANGAQLSNVSDTRDQNTNNVQGGSATGGAAHGNLSDNDNRSSVGNTSSNSGGNNLSNGGNTTGGNTLSNGSSSGGNTMTGGANTAQGGSASSTGTNLGINGQQQGIDRSGNSANTNANTAAQGQGQGQGQQQANNGTNAQGQTSANRNSQATNTSAGNGAGASAGAGAGAGAGSGNRTANTTRVDASDRSSTTNSYEAKTIVHAPVIHGQAAPALATAGLVMVPGQCGPRVQVIRRPVIGKRFGVWGGQSDVEQGYAEEVAPATDGNGIPVPFVQQDGYLMGHQVTQFVAVLGTSSAGSFSIGGFGKDGQGGQGGGAASGQLQQIVGKVAVIDCVMPSRVVAAAPVAPALVAAPMPAPRADRN